MKNILLQLKVVPTAERGEVPAPRLCDLCAHGAVMSGRARATESADIRREEVICLFLGRVIEMDVTECNRFSDRYPAPSAEATPLLAAESAWVA